MRVSVITISYNSVKTIEDTILSVLSQSYYNIEYLIIDGDSSDGTQEIISKFTSKLSVVVSEPDRGLYDAMNKGIALATGDLILMLNSDDIFYNKYVIQNIVDFHSVRNIDCSVGNIVQVSKFGEVRRKYHSRNWTPKKLKIGLMPPHPSIVLKRELFAKYGNYNLNFKIAADYELLIRYFIIHQISWEYSGITTTSMSIGGLSSSGIGSYLVISNEIVRALNMNNVRHWKGIIYFRLIRKLFDLRFSMSKSQSKEV